MNVQHLKGQATLFIVLGVLLIIGVASMVYFFPSSPSPIGPSSSDETFLYQKLCLEDTLHSLVKLSSLQGGFTGFPSPALQYTLLGSNRSVLVPYYIIDGEQFIPDQAILETELEAGLSLLAPPCFSESTTVEGVVVDLESLAAHVTIQEDSVTALISIPITIIGEDTTRKEEVLSIAVPTPLFTMHQVARKITTGQTRYGSVQCVDCLLQLMKETSLLIESHEISNNQSFIVVYTLVDPVSGQGFAFAHKFSIQPTSDIIMPDILPLTARVGIPFHYPVQATAGVPIRFSDDSGLFSINGETGTIDMIPTQEQIGIHLFTITAETQSDIVTRTGELTITS
ncbi:hypothetical protein HYS47_00945 [Candidatus Woesearchaeota archaeon]|nr:hypothetical protein [Candidatus Woesearchaeota archaeon]